MFRRQIRLSARTFIGGSAALLCAAAAIPAQAHDFWLQPRQASFAAGTDQSVDIFIGHAEDQSRWPLRPDRLIGLRTVGPRFVTDQVQYYNGQDEFLTIRTEEDGAHWLTIETQDAVSELPADKFQDYITNESLTAIQIDRTRTRRTDQPGVERYSRRGKTLLAVGDWQKVSDDHVTRPLGLTLEIIPKLNPLTVPSGAPLPLEVRYNGTPLSGAQIKIFRLDQDEGKKVVKTGADGRAVISKPANGTWMYHVIWGAPLPKRAAQDYDTIFSSFTFSVP